MPVETEKQRPRPERALPYVLRIRQPLGRSSFHTPHCCLRVALCLSLSRSLSSLCSVFYLRRQLLPLHPLPAPWTEEKDLKGRTYYSNHATKETTWEVSGKRESINRGGRGQQEALFFAPSQKRDVTEECARHSQLPEKFRRILCISHQK